MNLNEAVQAVIQPQPEQPVVFTPDDRFVAGHFYTHTDQLAEWPMAAPEYRYITECFQKVGHGYPVLLQGVPGLTMVMKGLITAGHGLTVYGPDTEQGRDAVEYVMEWFEAAIQAEVQAHEQH